MIQSAVIANQRFSSGGSRVSTIVIRVLLSAFACTTHASALTFTGTTIVLNTGVTPISAPLSAVDTADGFTLTGDVQFSGSFATNSIA